MPIITTVESFIDFPPNDILLFICLSFDVVECFLCVFHHAHCPCGKIQQATSTLHITTVESFIGQRSQELYGFSYIRYYYYPLLVVVNDTFLFFDITQQLRNIMTRLLRTTPYRYYCSIRDYVLCTVRRWRSLETYRTYVYREVWAHHFYVPYYILLAYHLFCPPFPQIL